MGHSDSRDALIARYPGHAELIERMHDSDPTFREICRDHHAVIASLATLDGRATVMKQEVEGFEALLGQLDAEITKYLTDEGNAPYE